MSSRARPAPVEILDDDAVARRPDLLRVDQLGETPVRPEVVAAIRARIKRWRRGDSHGIRRGKRHG
jgi:hypothetical protein